MIPKRLVPTRRTVCSLRRRRAVRRYSKGLADLAKQWNRLANGLDDAYALLKALNELDLKEATTSDGNLSFLEKANASQQAPRIRLP